MLRGLAGGAAVTLALPPLDAMLNGNGTAYADQPIPKRFGLFYWGNGVKVDRWNPSGTGPGYPLSSELAPLSSVKDYVSVVSGMNIRTGNERGHHAGTVGIVSGAPMVPQDPMGAPYASTFSAPSIDQVVAGHIGEATRFRSLELGVSRHVVTGEGTTLRYLSHNGPDSANPPEYSPAALFDRIFGTGFVAPDTMAEPDPRLRLRRSVLDAVLIDAAALRVKLGSVDKARLDQHFDGIRTLERQIARLEEMPDPPPLAACMAPGSPSDPGRDQITEISQVMSSLLAMALACDQTRVFSNMFSGSVSYTPYGMVGATDGHHGLTHDEPGDQPVVHAITTYIVEQFAGMLDALRNVTEGDGNLLDSCVILASSDTADGRGHTISDYPILVAGRGQGALAHPGVHFRSDGQNTTRVLLSLLQAMDLPYTEFGQGGGHVTAPCSEILAV
jgi:hypothetical protein